MTVTPQMTVKKQKPINVIQYKAIYKSILVIHFFAKLLNLSVNQGIKRELDLSINDQKESKERFLLVIPPKEIPNPKFDAGEGVGSM